MAKRKRNTKVSSLVSIFVLAIFISLAQAEQPFDITMCFSGTTIMVSASKELTVFSFDFNTILRSNHENRVFDNCTGHFAGIMKVMSGKRYENAYFKLMDPDGDFIVGEVIRAGTEEGTYKFLQGTGKWKDITGEGKSRTIGSGKPIAPDTFQMCNKIMGTFALPK